MTIRVAVDLMPLAYTLTGIGVYVQQLVTAIHQCAPDVQLGFASHCELPLATIMRTLFSRQLSNPEVNKLAIHLTFGCSPFGPLRSFCSSELTCRNFDLYHITNSIPHYRRYSVPTVVSVYDLADLRIDGNSTRYQSLIPAIRTAEHVICISEATQRDVIELLDVPHSRTTVTPLAPRPMFRRPPTDAQRSSYRNSMNRGIPYFLSVSTIEPRKNYVRALEAFAQIRAHGYKIEFLIAGAKRSGWPEVARTIRKLRLQDCVRVLGWVGDHQLLKLMWGCEALVYASLYEGFGLPVVEAMATGTPFIASNSGSMPEVVGTTLPLVDPLSVESIARQMEWAIENPASSALRERLIHRSSDYCWRSTAEQTAAVYRLVLES